MSWNSFTSCFFSKRGPLWTAPGCKIRLLTSQLNLLLWITQDNVQTSQTRSATFASCATCHQHYKCQSSSRSGWQHGRSWQTSGVTTLTLFACDFRIELLLQNQDFRLSSSPTPASVQLRTNCHHEEREWTDSVQHFYFFSSAAEKVMPRGEIWIFW